MIATDKQKFTHIIPVGDTGPNDGVHAASRECWCYPLDTEDGCIVHHAHDCREVSERQGRPIRGKTWIVVDEIVS